MIDEETHYRVLRLLEVHPDISQRAVARELNFSLGKANYSVRGLIRKGWVKVAYFMNSQQRPAHRYSLTRLGRREKARLTVRFVVSKMYEYEGLLVEIDEMKRGAKARSGRRVRTREA